MTDIGNTTSSFGDRSVTAFFDSESDAEQARADLIAAGLSPDSISVAGGSPAVHEAAPDDGGFWHALKEFFMPDEDRYTYAEGLRRGGYAVSVRTAASQYDRALDILDADGAVDIDERQKSWRDEGWTGFKADTTPMVDTTGMLGADASTAGFGASVAGEDGYAQPFRAPASNDAAAPMQTDPSRIGTGPDEPGRLNPDMRERIGAGTASMTPPTPTGSQGDAAFGNAADFDRGLSPKAIAEDAALGSPTRSGSEMPATQSTIGSVRSSELEQGRALDSGFSPVRRDDSIQRVRVRGYIADPGPTDTRRIG